MLRVYATGLNVKMTTLLAVRFAETPEEIAHFEECAKKQAKELKAVEDKIASLKQSLAELSETETSKTEKK